MAKSERAPVFDPLWRLRPHPTACIGCGNPAASDENGNQLAALCNGCFRRGAAGKPKPKFDAELDDFIERVFVAVQKARAKMTPRARRIADKAAAKILKGHPHGKV